MIVSESNGFANDRMNGKKKSNIVVVLSLRLAVLIEKKAKKSMHKSDVGVIGRIRISQGFL